MRDALQLFQVGCNKVIPFAAIAERVTARGYAAIRAIALIQPERTGNLGDVNALPLVIGHHIVAPV